MRQRRYPTVSVREGYREWLPSYGATVQDEMDLVLLAALESVRWAAVERTADLGCGTGRTGAWLRTRGVARIDGIDLTPEMRAIARGRGIYERLAQADVTATGLESGTCDLITMCSVCEDRPDDRGIGQRGDEAEAASTLGTRQHVDAERPVHQGFPAPRARTGGLHPGPSGPAARDAVEVVGSGPRRPETITRARPRARGASTPWQISRCVSGRGVSGQGAEDAETLDLLAQAFELCGQNDKAATLLVALGRIHRDQGRTTLSQDAFHRALDLNPAGAEAQRLLDEVSGKQRRIFSIEWSIERLTPGGAGD